jgi:hypothetical protein
VSEKREDGTSWETSRTTSTRELSTRRSASIRAIVNAKLSGTGSVSRCHSEGQRRLPGGWWAGIKGIRRKRGCTHLDPSRGGWCLPRLVQDTDYIAQQSAYLPGVVDEMVRTGKYKAPIGKRETVIRKGSGKVWEDTTLLDWDPSNDPREVGRLLGDVVGVLDLLRHAGRDAGGGRVGPG